MKAKALTISQPWADLIRRGLKVVENRQWCTSHRGRLIIHAGKGTQYLNKTELAKYPTGCVVAVADMVACLELAALRRVADRDALIDGTRYTVGQILEHKYTEGPYLWIFQDTVPVKPIVVPGKQGLWVWEFDALNVERDDSV